MSLTPEMRALLNAVWEALELPRAASTVEDIEKRARLAEERASDAQIIVNGVLKGQNVGDCIDQLNRWTAERPITYTVWGLTDDEIVDEAEDEDDDEDCDEGCECYAMAEDVDDDEDVCECQVTP